MQQIDNHDDDEEKPGKVIINKTGRRMRVFVLFAVMMGLGIVIHYATLVELITSIIHREGSSHGLFVPFISGFFLWKRWGTIKKLGPELSLLPGSIMVGVSLLMFYITRGNPENTLPALSFFMLVAGLVMVFFGANVFKEVGFPLLFLITMIPLPKNVYAHIAEWMRTNSTLGSVSILHLLGIPFHREGYYIYLSNTTLYVAESCSGIRYLISYFVFGFAYAFLYKGSIKSRILVVIATIPISIVAGMVRLAVIFLSAHFIGAFMAGHHPHIIISWFVFAFILAGVIFADQKWLHS